MKKQLLVLLIFLLGIGLLGFALPCYLRTHHEIKRAMYAAEQLKLLRDELRTYIKAQPPFFTTDAICLQAQADPVLQGGRWDDNCNYVTDFFIYQTHALQATQWLTATRLQDGKELYTLNLIRLDGSWGRSCIPYTSIGEQVCHHMFKYAWLYTQPAAR